jgi:rhodanese-related sulfurtransferase
VSRPSGARTIDEMLAAARARLRRLEPVQAFQAVQAGAVLVDIRPAQQRAAEGEIPGATIVERNVLEWRFDPACLARLPIARYDLQVIVFCSEGYTSSLAAASLLDLGLHRATDLDGGFKAWQTAGLPVVSPEPDAEGPEASKQGKLNLLATRPADGCATRARRDVVAGSMAPPLGW